VSGEQHNGKVLRDKGRRYLVAWKRISNFLAREYVNMWENNYLPFIQQYPAVKTLLVRYEDLKNNTIRHQVLHEVVDFIGLPELATRLPHPLNLPCSFYLADRKEIHRQRGVGGGDDRKYFVRKEEVFTPRVVCALWSTYLKQYAEPMGYRIFNDINCTYSVRGDESQAHS
jgi:hypothetical protein